MLLALKRNSHNDYRIYSEENLDRLQHILYLREIGLSIKDIYDLLIIQKTPPHEVFNNTEKQF